MYNLTNENIKYKSTIVDPNEFGNLFEFEYGSIYYTETYGYGGGDGDGDTTECCIGYGDTYSNGYGD